MNESPDRGEEEILGRLPRTRPGRRSPRRDETAARRARAAEGARSSGERASQARARPSAPRGRSAQSPPEGPGPGDALAGIAKTGVAVATGTVGLGLRVAGGALKAIRGTVERG